MPVQMSGVDRRGEGEVDVDVDVVDRCLEQNKEVEAKKKRKASVFVACMYV